MPWIINRGSKHVKWEAPAWKQILAHIVWIILENLEDLFVHKTKLDHFVGCILFRGPWKRIAVWANYHDPWEYVD